MSKVIDMTGQRYGKLVVIKEEKMINMVKLNGGVSVIVAALKN